MWGRRLENVPRFHFVPPGTRGLPWPSTRCSFSLSELATALWEVNKCWEPSSLCWSQGVPCAFLLVIVTNYNWASLVAQLVKNLPAMQETRFDPWVGKIHGRRDRLPTPVFLGFPCVSDCKKKSTCNAGDLGLIPGLGRSPGEGKATHSSILAWRIPWTV